MTWVCLSIEPELCGPISIGTARVVRLVMLHAQLGLNDAIRFVDRCVFDGDTVRIPTPSTSDARELVAALTSLSEPPKLTAILQD